MHRRPFLTLALALLVAACAGSHRNAEPPAPPKPPTEPIAWVPADATLVLSSSVEAFRASPFWSLWHQVEEKRPDVTSFVDIALVDHIVLAAKVTPAKGGTEPAGEEFLAAMRGRFGEGYLAKLAAAEQLVVKPQGLVTIVERGDSRWAQVSPDLLLSFTPALTERVVTRAGEGPGVPVRDGALFKALAGRVAFESTDFALLAEDASGAGKQALREQGVPGKLSRLADDVLRAGLSVDLGDHIVVRAVGETADDAHAANLTQALTTTLDALANNLFVGMLGLRPAVTALKPSQRGNFVQVDGTIAQADLEPVFRKLSAMIELAEGQADAPAP